MAAAEHAEPAMEIDEAAATETPEGGGADEAPSATGEGPAATPGAGKLSKGQKRWLRRQRTAAKAAEAEAAAKAPVEAAAGLGGKGHSHGRIQRRQAKDAREREDGAQDDNATATAKRLKQ